MEHSWHSSALSFVNCLLALPVHSGLYSFSPHCAVLQLTHSPPTTFVPTSLHSQSQLLSSESVAGSAKGLHGFSAARLLEQRHRGARDLFLGTLRLFPVYPSTAHTRTHLPSSSTRPGNPTRISGSSCCCPTARPRHRSFGGLKGWGHSPRLVDLSEKLGRKGRICTSRRLRLVGIVVGKSHRHNLMPVGTGCRRSALRCPGSSPASAGPRSNHRSQLPIPCTGCRLSAPPRPYNCHTTAQMSAGARVRMQAGSLGHPSQWQYGHSGSTVTVRARHAQ